MAFGNGYHEVRSVQLDNGEYQACIVKAEFKKYPRTGNDFVEVTVRVRGHDNEYPNTFTIDDSPKLGTTKGNGDTVSQKDIDKWCGRVTRFADSFKIADVQRWDLRNWIGKIGWVHCAEAYDPHEIDNKSKKYKQLTPFVPKENKTSQPQQAAQQQSYQQPPTPQEQPFTEDIPWDNTGSVPNF